MLLSFSVIISAIPSSAYSTQATSNGNPAKVSFWFAFFRSEPNLSFGNIQAIYLNGREVTVLGYEGGYAFVQDNKTKNKGYIHKFLLNDKTLDITKEYDYVYVDMEKEGSIKVNYAGEGKLVWELSKSGIADITQYDDRSFSVTGLSPGTVKLTVKCNGNKDSCIINCINKWEEPETSTAKNNFSLLHTPDSSNVNLSLSKGTAIKACGNIPNKKDYLYVYIGSVQKYGFISISDFPGIDYVLTQYHHYDNGYGVRFSSASNKIKDYASVLNDVTMENFNLKVAGFVEKYTSVADECKILRSGSVTSGNISAACKQTAGHLDGTCLTTANLRNDLTKQFGAGSGNISQIAWTGHIMTSNLDDRSNSTLGVGSIIITPCGVVNSSNFSNLSNSEVRKGSLYTLVHETGHQLNLYDYYCYKDMPSQGALCSNVNCADCNGVPHASGCIMLKRVKVEEVDIDSIYCDECDAEIRKYLAENLD